MKYHNIPFYIASQSIEKSKNLGQLLSHESNSVYRTIDIPEIYIYLKKCNDFTCFIIDISSNQVNLDNIIKSIHQKNPNFPIVLVSSKNIPFEVFRHYIRQGASDVLTLNAKLSKKEVLREIINVLNLKWRAYLYTLKENEKIFQATVVTANHEINQPLTVILNAIGLLKSELKEQAKKDIKIASHLNFIYKSTSRIQLIMETLRKVKKLILKEYTPGVWMINLYSQTPVNNKTNKMKINNKNTILVVEKNLDDITVIKNEIKKMGLNIVNTPTLKDAENVIEKKFDKIQAILFSANVPTNELENTLFELNNRKDMIPLILIRNTETSPESLKLVDSTAFQILEKPITSKSLNEAIAKSVIVAN